MATIYLVRHGRAAASWDKDHDPGLDDIGRRQATEMAQTLAPLGPLRLIASPMARTRETAAALATLWNCKPRIEPRVSEIPSPMQNLQTRGQWLKEIAAGTWRTLDEPLQQWRAALLSALREIDQDTVVVTHYIAINLAVGDATGDDRIVSFRPDYCSITTMQTSPRALTLVRRGNESNTKVL